MGTKRDSGELTEEWVVVELDIYTGLGEEVVVVQSGTQRGMRGRGGFE